jgi:hypothetical protein
MSIWRKTTKLLICHAQSNIFFGISLSFLKSTDQLLFVSFLKTDYVLLSAFAQNIQKIINKDESG